MTTDTLKGFMPEQQPTDRVVAAVKKVSDQIGRSMAQVALAWLGYRPVPVIPVIGARKHLQDNLAGFDLTLSAEQLKTLEEASCIELGFPITFMKRNSCVQFAAACATRSWPSCGVSL